jgi:5'-nucleotidase
LEGNLGPLVDRLSPDIKVVLSGHTHQAYNCTIGGRLVTSASSFGRMYTRVTLTLDRATGTITGASAVNEVVTRDVARDPTQTALIERYRTLAAPIATRVVGSLASDITRAANRAGESALGGLIADAQLAATRGAVSGGAAIALMNAGGIRADLLASKRAGDEPAGQVTYSELFEVQPFGNSLTVITLTGAMLERLLEQQFRGAAGDRPTRLLQVSAGFTYSYRLDAPPGQHVVPGSIRLNGRPVAPAQAVRVAVVDYLADGGDAFSVFLEGTDRFVGMLDVDALAEYFGANSPVSPGPQNRIVRID